MIPTSKHLLISVAIAAVMGFTGAHAQDTTPDSVKTRIGDLNFERGFPTEETKHKALRRDGLPARRAGLSCGPIRQCRSNPSGLALMQAQGMDLNDLGIADNFADAKGLWLTANDTTIYGI